MKKNLLAKLNMLRKKQTDNTYKNLKTILALFFNYFNTVGELWFALSDHQFFCSVLSIRTMLKFIGSNQT